MPPTPLTTHAEPVTAGRRRLALRGDLDYDNAHFARQAVAAAQSDARELVIDVSGVEKADVFGLAVLLKAWHAGPRNGCRIRLVRAPTADAMISGDGMYPSGDAWCSDSVTESKPRPSAHSHWSRAAS